MAYSETQLPSIPKVISIPGLSTEANKILSDAFSSIQENIEVRTGIRGNILDQAATWRHLQNAGLDIAALEPGNDAIYDFESFAADDTPPGPPEDFVITNQVFANKLTWTNPIDDDFFFVEIWVSLTNDRTAAYCLGVVTGNPGETAEFTHDSISLGTDYYYWIRAADTSYNYSTWVPDDETGGEEMAGDVRETINELLAELTDESSYGDIFKLYYDAFMVIKPLDTFPAWALSTDYTTTDPADTVRNGGNAYVCILNHTSTADDEPGIGVNWTTYWEQLSSDVMDGINVFTIGSISGNPTVGIRGDLIIDGGILARMVAAEAIEAQHIKLGAVDWDDHVSGSNKPEDNATYNEVYVQASQPGSPTDGEFWFDTVNLRLWQYQDSTWTRFGTQLLADEIGDLDDITDGSSYGKTRLAILDSGYLYLMRRAAGGTQQILITASAVQMYQGGNMLLQLASGALYIYNTLGNIIATYGTTTCIGQEASGKNNVYIDSNGIYLRVYTTDVITITNAGVGLIDLIAGSDIILHGHATNPAVLKWNGSSYDTWFYADATGVTMNFHPMTTSVAHLYFGLTTYRWASAQFFTSSSFAFGTSSYVMQLDESDAAVFCTPDSGVSLGKNTVCFTNVYADAGVTSCSDKKFKKDIQQETLGLDFINSIVPISWYWKKMKGDTARGRFHGFMAQEIEEALIEQNINIDEFAGVAKGKEEDGVTDRYGLIYEQLIGPCVRAIQEICKEYRDHVQVYH